MTMVTIESISWTIGAIEDEYAVDGLKVESFRKEFHGAKED